MQNTQVSLNTPRVDRRLTVLMLLAVVVAIFAAVNLAILFMMDNIRPGDYAAVWVYLCFGVIASQPVLIPIWAAFGRGHWRLRFAVVLAVAAGLFLCWVIGGVLSGEIRLSQGSVNFNAVGLIRRFGCGLPLVLLGGIAPLIAWRIYARARIESDFAADARAFALLGLGDYFAATAIVAVAMGLLRLGYTRQGFSDFSEYAAAVGLAAAAALGVSLMVIAPLLVLTLRVRSIVEGIALLVGYAVVGLIIWVVVMHVFYTNRFDGWQFFGVCVSVFGFLVCTIAPLAFLRNLGFRLTESGPILNGSQTTFPSPADAIPALTSDVPAHPHPKKINMSADDPRQQLSRMLSGYWLSQAAYVAAKLKIADRLVGGPKTAQTLASETNANADNLYRVLRALASVGLFAETDGGQFTLTPMAEYLREDAPDSQWATAVMMGEEHFRAWGELLHTVQTGEIAFDMLFGKPIFEYLSEHPNQAAVFDRAMTSIHGQETQPMVDAYDFSDIGTLADIGGGNGTVISAVLASNPAMRGILFDLPHVVQRAQANLQAAGLADRCRTVAGSFFETAPAGADACIMRHIIHDWDDERAIQILKNCHAALPNAGRVLVVESIVAEKNEPSFAKLLDLTMMVLPGGKERTVAEYRELLSRAGFELTQITPTASDVSVIEGRKISK